VLNWIDLLSSSSQMNDPRLLDQIGARISEVLATSPARDVEKNVRALLAAFFDRFDLVTRDDFEAQKRVLERARVRIADLERRLSELEASQAGRPPL
jgi:BMFP domain-containing protein YqiC